MRSDEVLLRSDVICLTETWLMSDAANESLMIPGYRLHLNSAGRGKGIAMYTKMSLAETYIDVKRQKSQITRLITPNVDIINIYMDKSPPIPNIQLPQGSNNLMEI